MGQRLVLHIGLMKSGTTSIQRALGAQRAYLRPQAVHYPDLGQDSHILSFVEVLVDDPVAFERFPTGLRRHVLETRAVWDGMFAALCDLIDTDTTSRTVLSAENLIYAGPGSLDRLAAEFDPFDLRVVVTHRRPSRALVSNYQQQARITLMPDVESWSRTQLAGLAADDDRISVASLRLDALTRRWRQFSPDVVLVDTDGDPEVSLLAMWDALAGVRPPERLDARVSNASLPHGFLVGVQSFQAENPTYSVARLRHAIAAALPRYRSQVSEEVPAPVLQHDVADLLDTAVADGTHTRWIELERRLRDDSPVVRPQTEADARMERTLGALAHAELQRADRREAPRRVVRRLRAVRRR